MPSGEFFATYHILAYTHFFKIFLKSSKGVIEITPPSMEQIQPNELLALNRYGLLKTNKNTYEDTQ